MAILEVKPGERSQPQHIYSDTVIDVTSVDPANPTVIVPWRKIVPGKKLNIAIKESNTKLVRIQPWIAIREPASVTDGDKIEYSPTTDYWEIPADGRDHIAVQEEIQGLWIQVTGYLAVAGTAKVHVDILLS